MAKGMFPMPGLPKGFGGMGGRTSGGFGQKLGPRSGSAFPLMKKFMLYRNVFGNTPAVRKRMGSMGPIMGKPQTLMSGQPISQNTGNSGMQEIAGFHRMGLL